jgi:hypothetical protein
VSDPLAVLRRVRSATPPGPVPVGELRERCELCSEPLPDEHQHLVDLRGRALMCACRACWLLFTSDGAGGGHYRAVPDRWMVFPDFRMSGPGWDALQIPVSVAFFFVNSQLARVAAFYPGPAGATESLLSLEAWADVVANNPELATLVPDVEAFLVRMGRDGGCECYLVPIDACYELVGQLRRSWRGFDGGREAHDSLDAFFDRVRARAR